MTPVTSEADRANVPTPPGEDHDFYEQTTFWRAAKNFGVSDLVGTWGSAVAIAAGGGLLFLYLRGDLADDGLKALGVAYISLGAALFGIVLAGLAVVAAFFDREYVLWLREHDTLRPSFFAFWWTAALAVVSLLASIALTVTLYAGASRTLTAVMLMLATVLFVAALLEALALVGTMMRHGMYRAEYLAGQITVRRSDEGQD